VLPFSESWIRFRFCRRGGVRAGQKTGYSLYEAATHRHSELEANVLTPQEAENDNFSEYALIQQTNSADLQPESAASISGMRVRAAAGRHTSHVKK